MRQTLFFLALVVLVPATRAAPLWPSEALHDVFVAMAAEPSRQVEIARAMLPRVRTQELSRDEKFALAEFHFIAVQPDAARTAFQAFAGGDDLYARVAQQKLLWMQMVAGKNFEGVAESIQAYRSRFAPTPADPRHLSGPVFALAEHHQSIGEHDEAVALVRAELASLPGDAPYHSLRLPAQLMRSYVAIGAAAEADAAIAEAQLRLARFANQPNDVPDAVSATPTHRVGAIHRREELLLIDHPQPWHDALRARDLLRLIPEDLARAERGEQPQR